MAQQQARQPARELARVDATKATPAVIPVGPDQPPDPIALGRMALAAIGEGRIDAMDVDTQRRFLIQMARTLGLNPVTNPFLIIRFEKDGKKTLYLTKGGAEQLAGVHRVSTEVVRRWTEFGMLMTLVRAQQGERFADATGVVPFETADGHLLPIAARPRIIKISESQARRRAILGLLGLGFLDRPTPQGDPDEFADRHGNPASRPAQRELPASTATVDDIFGDDYEEPGLMTAEVVGVRPEDVAAAAAESSGSRMPLLDACASLERRATAAGLALPAFPVSGSDVAPSGRAEVPGMRGLVRSGGALPIHQQHRAGASDHDRARRHTAAGPGPVIAPAEAVSAELRRAAGGGVWLAVYYRDRCLAYVWFASAAAAMADSRGRQFVWRAWAAIGSPVTYRGALVAWSD